MIKQFNWVFRASCMQWSRNHVCTDRFSSSRATMVLFWNLKQTLQVRKLHLVTEICAMCACMVSWQILLNLKLKESTSLASACNIYKELNVKLFVSIILKWNCATFSCRSFMISLCQLIFRKKYQTFDSFIFSQLLILPSLNLTFVHKRSLRCLSPEKLHRIILEGNNLMRMFEAYTSSGMWMQFLQSKEQTEIYWLWLLDVFTTLAF